MESIFELAIGYWLIFILSLVAITLICTLLLFLFKNKQKLIVTGGILTLVVTCTLFFLLPIQIKHQVQAAMDELDAYLTATYPNDSWTIIDTDPDQLEDHVELHVRFSNEEDILYAYKLIDKTFIQTTYWGINGESSNELTQAGIHPKHPK